MRPDEAPFLKLAAETARRFGFDPRQVTLASHSENLVYRVETTGPGDFAVRLHRPGYHTLDELESEQVWTAALNDAGIAVPVGEPGPDGRYYQPVVLPTGEQRYAGVVGWLPGVPLAQLLDANVEPAQLIAHFASIGELTARLHNQASNWRVPPTFRRHSLDASGLMGESPFWGPFWDLPEFDSATRKQVCDARPVLYDLLAGLDKDPAHYSLIHADLHTSNLLVDGESITIIDFDDAGFGWHVYDMAVTLFWVGDQPAAGMYFDAYVEGYRSARDLSDAALALYPVFRLVRGLASLGWAHHRREIDRNEGIARMLDIVRPLISELC